MPWRAAGTELRPLTEWRPLATWEQPQLADSDPRIGGTPVSRGPHAGSQRREEVHRLGWPWRRGRLGISERASQSCLQLYSENTANGGWETCCMWAQGAKQPDQ